MSWQAGPQALSLQLRSSCLKVGAGLARPSTQHKVLQSGGLCLAGGLVFASSSLRGRGSNLPARSSGNFLQQIRRDYFQSVTKTLISLNVILYGLQFLSKDRLTLALLKTREGILGRGQLYRLATCCFMHGDALHLVANMQSLYNIGRALESLSGRARYATVYAVGGLSGSLASLIFSPNPSLGASGAIFGLVGAQLVFNQRHKGHLSPHYDRILDSSTEGMLASISLTFLYGLFTKHLDQWGHVGGFLGGALAAYLLGPYFSRKGNVITDSPPLPILAAGTQHKR